MRLPGAAGDHWPMSDAKQSWEEVASKFSGLGQKLKQHLDEERATSGAESTEQAKRDVKAALGKLADSLDDAFDALGRAAKDPDVRQDVSEAGRTLVGAIGTSLDQLGDEVRRVVERRKQRSGEPTQDASEPGDGAGEADGMAQG